MHLCCVVDLKNAVNMAHYSKKRKKNRGHLQLYHLLLFPRNTLLHFLTSRKRCFVFRALSIQSGVCCCLLFVFFSPYCFMLFLTRTPVHQHLGAVLKCIRSIWGGELLTEAAVELISSTASVFLQPPLSHVWPGGQVVWDKPGLQMVHGIIKVLALVCTS